MSRMRAATFGVWAALALVALGKAIDGQYAHAAFQLGFLNLCVLLDVLIRDVPAPNIIVQIDGRTIDVRPGQSASIELPS